MVSASRNFALDRIASLLAILMLAFILSACGGGGGSSSTTPSGGGSSGGGGPPGGGTSSASPTVTVDKSQVSATVAPGDPAPNYQVTFTITDPSGVAVYAAYKYGKTAIQGVSASWPNSVADTQQLTLSFVLFPPALIGSGTYQDQIQVEFCLDQQCASPISGSPITISVSYTVTGNVVSNAVYVVTPSASVTVEAPDTASSATVAISVAAINGLPPFPVTLVGQSQANGVVASGSWSINEGGTPTGTLTVNLKSPSNIGPGVYSDTITISVCYDATCTKEALGSPWVLPVTYTVTASAGVDYVAQMLAGVTATDIAYSSVTGKLYAVTASYSAQSSSSLLEIEPATATVTRSLPLVGGQSPIVLSISDDGSYAYVGFSDQGVVERVALSTLTLDLSIALPIDPTYGAPVAGYLLAMPGAPHSWAVSLYTNATGLTDNDSRGTYIFDDATQRPNTFLAPNASTPVMALAFGSGSSTLYAYSNADLFTAAVSSGGLAQTNEVTGVGINPDIYYLSGSLYGDDSSVTNASTGAKTAEFLPALTVLEPVIALDDSLNRAYFYYQEQTNPAPLWTFATYNLQTQVVGEKTRVNGCTLFPGGVNGKAGRLIRVGTNGLAVNCHEGIEIISGVFVTD
jgi:hypothetical protein